MYKIDFIKFCRQMVPPILRSAFLLAIIRAMIVPLKYIYAQFHALKDDIDNSLNTTANVIYLQKALNDAFFLTEEIYIDTPNEQDNRAMYFESEHKAILPMHFSDGKALYLKGNGESTAKYNFTVHVPTFLCTSLEKEEDRFKGVHLLRIINILNKYKPAGRTYHIELYDHE